MGRALALLDVGREVTLERGSVVQVVKELPVYRVGDRFRDDTVVVEHGGGHAIRFIGARVYSWMMITFGGGIYGGVCEKAPRFGGTDEICRQT